jgi:hypothetical protein
VRGGRKLAFVTASDLRLAQPIASYLGIFDEVIASDGITNVKGSKKAKLLVRRFGKWGFIYTGNDTSDLPVWRESCGAILVNAPRRVRRAVDNQGQPRIVLPGSRRLLKAVPGGICSIPAQNVRSVSSSLCRTRKSAIVPQLKSVLYRPEARIAFISEANSIWPLPRCMNNGFTPNRSREPKMILRRRS